MSDDNAALTGKMIFFVHPSAFVQNVIIEELVQQEYEVYIVKDETKLQKILKNHTNSIVLASIDETLSAAKWEAWIRQIMGEQATRDVDVGILSSTNSDDARRLYINTLKVSCGFIHVKTDKTKVVDVLLAMLKAADAKGRRKYIRADTRDEKMTTINLPTKNGFVTGEIRDISVVGLACTFPEDPELVKNELFPNIQIKLQGVLIKAEGIVFGFRMDGPDKVYVFLFTAKVDPAVRVKIRTYIQKNLQIKMDEEMKF
ncbi:MAG: PilZ domain-containing protein [Spirochaetaceae bacterium]|jgi:hypothetical protein|nr:PilZ domain-containing protein [Spirochaetaceae bacterium]